MAARRVAAANGMPPPGYAGGGMGDGKAGDGKR